GPRDRAPLVQGRRRRVFLGHVGTSADDVRPRYVLTAPVPGREPAVSLSLSRRSDPGHDRVDAAGPLRRFPREGRMHAKTIRSLTAALAVTVVAAGLVGCSDDDGGDASDAGTTTTGGAPGEVAAAPSAGCTSP